ncbi:MAG: Hsp20/alpha crystallin family protein, partial [Flammeovirgaceae bacterium]
RREFYYTNFKKSYELPEAIDVNNIEASYENGILMINLPKVKEAETVEREIKIQ